MMGLGRAHRVQNVHNGKFYALSTVRRHIPNYEVPELYQKVDINYETRISLIRPGKRTSKRKDIVGYVDYCNDTNLLDMDTFHLGMCILVRYAEEPMLDNILDSLNDKQPYCSVAKRNGGFIYPNEVHIFTLVIDFKPSSLPEPLTQIVQPL